MTLLPYKTYLSMIRLAPGTKMFQHLYASVDGKETDIVENGDLSCAFFVTSILYQFGWLKFGHATVSGTVKDLEESGWKKVETPVPGAVIVWPEGEESRMHKHIGFWQSETEAVSNSTKEQVPAVHHPTYGTHEDGTPVRPITAFYIREDWKE